MGNLHSFWEIWEREEEAEALSEEHPSHKDASQVQ